LMAALGIVETVRDVHPDAVVALAEVGGEPSVGHEMEPADLHEPPPSGSARAARVPHASHGQPGKTRLDRDASRPWPARGFLATRAACRIWSFAAVSCATAPGARRCGPTWPSP